MKVTARTFTAERNQLHATSSACRVRVPFADDYMAGALHLHGVEKHCDFAASHQSENYRTRHRRRVTCQWHGIAITTGPGSSENVMHIKTGFQLEVKEAGVHGEMPCPSKSDRSHKVADLDGVLPAPRRNCVRTA